nr:MAG TPA: hypothetical protein [Caudoviricetes sp.]
MDGITINDKQYIFTTESGDCKDCVFYNVGNCGVVCHGIQELAYGHNSGISGVFKKLKIEK